MSKIKEVIEKISQDEGLTEVQVLDKYPDLKRLLHQEQLKEKQTVHNENKELLRG